MIDDALSRRIIIYAALSGALGITLGALGAHGLERFLQLQEIDPELIEKRMGQFDTGVRYHLVHTVALLALAALPFGAPAVRHWVCRLFLLGIVLFSGSLYALAFTNISAFGMFTPPVGGLCWILGWLLLLLAAKRSHAS